MNANLEVKRVRADQWREARDFRLEALRDPLASLAFLETYENRHAMPDEFWQERAAGAADSSHVSQWIAESEGQCVGTATVIVLRAGDDDYYGNRVTEDRALLVAVYVPPQHRRAGVVERLVDAAAAWAGGLGFGALHLDVHPDNTPAIKAYLRCGFVDTGERVSSGDTWDVVMRLDLGSGLEAHDS